MVLYPPYMPCLHNTRIILGIRCFPHHSVSPEHNHDNLASSRDQKSANNELGRRLVTHDIIIQTYESMTVSKFVYHMARGRQTGNSKVVAKSTTTSER